MTEWQKVKLGDVCTFQNGYAFKSTTFSKDGKYKVIKIKEIKDGQVVFFDDTTLVDVNLAEYSKYSIIQNDIVFALTGDPVSKGNPLTWVGRVAIYKKNGSALLNQRLCKAIPNKQQLDSNFLYYYFRDSDIFLELALKGTGSANQVNISHKTIENFDISLPPLDEQKRIAKILSSLDDKIENNNAINKNLEEQAQAINKSWFMNFEPFGGTMPSDWKEGVLGDLVLVKYGKDHKKLEDGIYPVFGSGGVMRYVERPLYSCESVLIPRKGTLNNVLYVNEPFWSVDTMFYTEMKFPNLVKFIFHFIKNKDLLSMNAGSAVPSMTTEILNKMELAIPSAEILERFETLVSPIYETIVGNTKENQKLSQIRDTLLPKLMSGEVRV